MKKIHSKSYLLEAIEKYDNMIKENNRDIDKQIVKWLKEYYQDYLDREYKEEK